MNDHELKIWPQYFAAVSKGIKTFEYRKNDRNFRRGDTVTLREYEPRTGYTGKEIRFRIGYVLQIDSEYVVFSILKPTT